MTTTTFCLDDILKRGRTVTNKYVKEFGKWTIEEQISHIRDEVREFDWAVHGMGKKNDNPVEEGCDIIYTVITAFHVLGISDKEILEQLQFNMKKIERRCNQRCIIS